MHTPAGPFDVDDDGVVDHAIHDGGGDDGISQVVAKGLEPNVLRKAQFYAKLSFYAR